MRTPLLFLHQLSAKKKNLFVFLFLITGSFILYAHTFSLYLFQDDYVWLSRAKDAIKHPWIIFSTSTTNLPGFFMPVIYGYFAVAYRFFALHTAYYYAFNIFLHGLNAFLLYVLLKTFFKQRWPAAVSAVLFLSFRYQMEAVVWLSAVTELLTTSLLLSAGITWVKYLQTSRKYWYACTLLFTVFLLFTKEWSVLILPLVVGLSLAHYWNNAISIRLKSFLSLVGPFLLLFAGYFLFEFIQPHPPSPLFTQGFYTFGWHAIPNVLSNVLLIFLPLTEFARQHWYVWNTLSFIVIICFLICSFILWSRQKNSLPILSIFWILGAFVPTSFFTWDPLVSRYSYLPAIGAAILLGQIISSFFHQGTKFQKIAVTACVMLFIVANGLFIWRVTESFYLPPQKENKKFDTALQEAMVSVPSDVMIAIYPNTPHKSFILPDIIHVLTDRPKNTVIVQKLNEACSKEYVCLKWNSTSKQVEIIK